MIGFVSAFVLVVPLTVQATNFTVTTTTDSTDAALGDGACDDGTGACSLRAALM